MMGLIYLSILIYKVTFLSTDLTKKKKIMLEFGPIKVNCIAIHL